jgi:hypothetical protein
VSLRFSYRRFPVAQPLTSLGGRLERPRPTILVSLTGPQGTFADLGLLDTGADDTLFPEYVAARIGIDLSNAPAGSGAGVGMQGVMVRYAEATLRVSDSQEDREWKAWVGFTSAKLRQPLLGYAGFMQFFTAAFHGDLEEVELTINPTYPGS